LWRLGAPFWLSCLEEEKENEAILI
jgi:hypothetical protein